MVGSVDRHAQPDQPDQPDQAGPAGRPDAAREQPKSPRETEAQLAERLGLPTLTRAGAYESLYARAIAQDAPFRERLAREEAAGKRESLSEASESRAPQDLSKPPTDKPERDLETTRNYWTEVPHFFANWERHADTWRRFLSKGQPERSDSGDPSRNLAVERISRAEPPISENFTRVIDDCSRRARVVGFEFRLKGFDRIKEKVSDKLAAEPDKTADEIVREIPDAIRYTCYLDTEDYSPGFAEVKAGLENCGYEMYYSKNYWSNPEYKGLNTRWVTPEGQRFEVQLHTLESFHAKHEVTHKAYERLRDPATSQHERIELRAFQQDVSSWIPIPPHAADIADFKKEDF